MEPGDPDNNFFVPKQEEATKREDDSSFNEVRMENHLSGMKDNLESVTGNDWAELRTLLKGGNLTDEEEQAIEETIRMVQTMRSSSSDEPQKANLGRFAKMSKIIDVATARRFLKGHIVPFHSTDKIGLICSAVEHLHEILALISNKYDVQEATNLSGQVINGKELEEAIERGKSLNIS